MSWYRAGTINLTNGSVDVVGVGTAFKSEVRFSDILLVNGTLHEIVRIESDTKLKLATPWTGATQNGVAFAVIRNLTNASNYDLMKKVEEFLTDRQRSMDEFVNWINATPVKTGAPDAGKFPLTDRYGVKVFCKSPQQLEYEAGVRLNRQDELIDETEAILTESEARLAAIGNQQAWANQILGYKNDAAASATLAQKWADNNENVAVTTGKYSAKHHAIKAAASQADVTTRQADVTTKHNNVITLEQQAQAARTAAQTSETNAKTSETNAAGSATGAANSASAAAASKTGADAAKTAAEAAKTAAQTSETNSANSAAAAASSASASAGSANASKDWAEKTTGPVTGSQYSAKYHSQQAQAAAADVTTKQADIISRQADVQTRQADVQNRQNNVISLESSALSSKNAAAASATNASTKATEASNSATASATSAANALTSETKASKWAEEAENVTVETGKYSAKHHATKAAASATAAASSATAAATSKSGADSAKTAAETARNAAETARNAAQTAKAGAEAARDTAIAAAATLTGNLVEYGSIDLSGGTYPAAPTNAGFWKVTVGGTVGGVEYGVGDTLVYSKNLNEFYKIDNTESVTSVNGKTGAVALVPSDIGALAAGGTAVAANKLATARTISFTGGATGSGAFDGSANISVSLTVANNSHAHTIANVTGLQAALDAKQNSLGYTPIRQGTGTGQGTNTVHMGWSANGLLLQVDSTDFANVWPISISGNAGTATKLQTARTIGGVAFDGTANINLPGVNAAGNQNTSGNAATATKLQTARTINGVAFDGSANITVADATKLPLTGGTLTGTLTGTKGVFTGTGNDYHLGGLEVVGNGSSNAVFPTIGFHQPGLYASSIQLRGGGDFRFYAQGGTSYASVTAANFNGNTCSLTGRASVGDVLSQGWLRTVGTTGWFNETYAGGIHMQDATYVRVYNGKAFYCAGNEIVLEGNSPTMRFYDNNWGNRYIHCNDSLIGFLSASFSWTFRVDNDGNAIATGNVTAYSDIRLKKDIELIPDALDKVCALRGVTYERIDSGERHTGVIAQEVQAVLPEAVMTGSDKDATLSVAYGNMVGLLIEAIKELKAEVDDLKMKVAA